ncbi:MAG: ABC transporter ATP-binding protein [Thermoplasmatota archaeon]
MPQAALAARGLSKTFGTNVAVDSLDLEVREGEIFALVGPNGAGKTTTLRMVAGLTKATNGIVEINGVPVGPKAPPGERLGYCPQENVLYGDLTARENLAFAASIYNVPKTEQAGRISAVLKELDILEKADVQGSTLSGGMKRRLTIALALIHDPKVVIFDEPEAGLDPQTRVAVREYIRGLRSRKTVVLTSHNMDEVERLADRVAIMDHGRIQALGAPDELREKHGVGDVLEIILKATPSPDVLRALGGLGPLSVEGVKARLTVRGAALGKIMPYVAEILEKQGAELVDVRYRTETLEDIFLNVTGRRLRE